MFFQCVACRVFALVGMVGCLKNIQKQWVLERCLKIVHFAWTWDCLRNLIEDEAEIRLVCSWILEEISDRFLIDFEVDLGSEIGSKWGRKSSWKGDLKKKGKRWAYRGQLGVQDGVMLGWKSKKIGAKHNNRQPHHPTKQNRKLWPPETSERRHEASPLATT